MYVPECTGITLCDNTGTQHKFFCCFTGVISCNLFTVLQGVFISKIAEGGTAERDGRLQVGDKVLSVRAEANLKTDGQLHAITDGLTGNCLLATFTGLEIND